MDISFCTGHLEVEKILAQIIRQICFNMFRESVVEIRDVLICIALGSINYKLPLMQANHCFFFVLFFLPDMQVKCRLLINNHCMSRRFFLIIF